ncbi:MAG TPA: thermonuclease family protein [Verrucomicrobiae bacterium]|jgi:micrococcal nuclease|nr:thermonuclease family protein [Verrucomicrobiae bacterium]
MDVNAKYGRTLLGFALVFFLAGTASAEKVRHVIDGDTFVLEDNQRVRLIGVDTPEIDHPRYNRPGEYYGEEARLYLKKRVEGKDVRLENGPEGFDKYGRRLAYVYEGGVLVNADLIALGFGEATRAFPHPRQAEFLELEEQARQKKAGLWDKTSVRNSRPPALRRAAAWVTPVLAVLFLLPLFRKRR